jgi:hypothetical protein
MRRASSKRPIPAAIANVAKVRAVPLPARTAQALSEHPPRLDTRLLFPGARGGHLNLKEIVEGFVVAPRAIRVHGVTVEVRLIDVMDDPEMLGVVVKEDDGPVPDPVIQRCAGKRKGSPR